MPSRDDLRNGFRLGAWEVLPERNLLRSAEGEASLERLAMDVLLTLAIHQGELVTKDDLVDAVWDGRPQMDDVITQKISLIRKALDDHKKPHEFVETIFGRGYRLRKALELVDPPAQEEVPSTTPWYLSAWAFGLIAIAVVIALVFLKPDSSNPVDTDQAMRSVVVFPFQCSRSEDDYLCNGFSVMLTSTLSQLDDLKVVKSRTPFPNNLTEPQIAANFGVDGVIWGEVTRMGESLVVNADLVDGRSGFLQFSNVYDTVAGALLDTQEQVANDVRMSIRGDRTPALRTPSRPASYAVLKLFWKADYEFAKRSNESMLKAIDLFEQTIELDPDYGPAYLRLAYATALLPDYSDEPREEMYDRALQIAQLGIDKDEAMAAPGAAIFGFVHLKRANWIAAQKAFEAALAGHDETAQVHHLYSRLLASVGRLDASLEHAKLARALDPYSGVLISRLAISYYWMNDIENAETLFKLTEKQPEFVLPINDLAYAFLLVRQNDFEKAERVAATGLRNLGIEDAWVGQVFSGMQNPDKAQPAVERVVELAEAEALPEVVQITLWTIFGQIEEAMKVARLLETEGEIFEAEILFSPDFRVLREHPDFLPLMKAIGIADYWDSVGCRWEDDAVVCAGQT